MVILSKVKYLDYYYKADSSITTSSRQVVQGDSNRIIQKSLLINETDYEHLY